MESLPWLLKKYPLHGILFQVMRVLLVLDTKLKKPTKKPVFAYDCLVTTVYLSLLNYKLI